MLVLKRCGAAARWVAWGCVWVAVAACQTMPEAVLPVQASVPKVVSSTDIKSPAAWGAQARCRSDGCLLAVVEHTDSRLALYRLQGRSVRLLDRVNVGFHPDGVIWLNDQLLAAAVEGSTSIDVFDTTGDKLTLLQQVNVGFQPRDVTLMPGAANTFHLVATPYRGEEVARVDLAADGRSVVQPVRRERWCKTPWHPALVASAPQGRGPGLAVGCLDDNKLLYVGAEAGAKPQTIHIFGNVPRRVMPSPSGRWWYVVQELGGRNARIDAQTGSIQWLNAPSWGAVSVLPLDDNLVVWGDDMRVFLQRYDDQGQVLETRTLRASGFPTGLQLQDADGDSNVDLFVFNSTGEMSNLHYGPLWENATPLSMEVNAKPK